MFRQVVLTVAALLSATILVSEAAAREAPSRWLGDLAHQATDRTFECIIEHDPELIVSWFDTLPGSSLERKLYSRLESQFMRCFSNKAQMVGWVPQYDYAAMRVAVLQFLLKSGSIAVPEGRPPGLDRAAWYAPEGSIPAESVIANDLGFCLARSDWPAARAAVLSLRGSKEESESLRKLVPLVGGCIPAGAKLKIDIRRLREILEETAYHAVGGTSAGALGAASKAAKTR